MNIRHTTLALLTGLLIAAGTSTVPAQQDRPPEYKVIPVETLRDSPQFFWARPIVFEDVLEAQPSGRTTKLDGKKYGIMKTETLGECYAAEELISKLNELEAGESYLFAGTVFQKRKKNYLYIIEGVSPTIKALEEMANDIEQIAANPNLLPETDEMRVISVLVNVIEKAIFAYAEERDIEVEEMFVPGTENNKRVKEIVTSGLRRMELQQEISSTDILSRYLAMVLARRYGGNLPPPEAVPEVQPEAAMVPDEEPDVPMVAPEPKPEMEMEDDIFGAVPLTGMETDSSLDEPVVLSSEFTIPETEPEPEPIPEPESMPEPIVEPEPETVVAEEIDLEDLDAALSNLEIEPDPLAELTAEIDLEDIDSALDDLDMEPAFEDSSEPAANEINLEDIDAALDDLELEPAVEKLPELADDEVNLEDIDSALNDLDLEEPAAEDEIDLEDLDAALMELDAEPAMEEIDFNDIDAALGDLDEPVVEEKATAPPRKTFRVGPFILPVLPQQP